MTSKKNEKRWTNKDGVEVEVIEPKKKKERSGFPFFKIMNNGIESRLCDSSGKLMYTLRKQYPTIMSGIKSNNAGYLISKIMTVVHWIEIFYLIFAFIFIGMPIIQYLLNTYVFHREGILVFGYGSFGLFTIFTCVIIYMTLVEVKNKYSKEK